VQWDSVSRKWKEMETFVCSIKLLMVDEIHFIADEERGATLEAAVCRMKSISAWKQQQVATFFCLYFENLLSCALLTLFMAGKGNKPGVLPASHYRRVGDGAVPPNF
jgi:hypothetical protein